MGKINKNAASASSNDKANPSKSKKMRWREIEQLKDQHQLEKDLKTFDYSMEYMLDEF